MSTSPVVSKFPEAGTRTARYSVNAVELNNAAGEHLFFRLTAEGGQPAFAFGCTHHNVLKADDFPGHPKEVYEWTWGKKKGEIDAANDLYVLALSFAGIVKYTLVVELRASDDSLKLALKDVNFESQKPTDKFRETLRVLPA